MTAYPQFDVILKALNLSSVGVIITDPEQKDNPIIFVNTGFENITGYAKEEALGSNCHFLQGDDTDKEEVAKIRHAINQKSTANVLLKNYRKDGTSFMNELTIEPIYDDHNHLYFVGIQKDVTNEHDYQLELEKSLTEIEKLSTPIVPIKENICVLPLIGSLTHDRFQHMSEYVSEYMDHGKEDYLIMDLSGLAEFNEDAVMNLVKFHGFMKLTGVELIITGISPKFAMTLIRYEENLASLTTYSTIKEALQFY
ncbi:blue-light photoreceptor [Listeria monocytogenes]|uniref:blue-light photoreceptor n=1 Tax=Listeria monocytogenes TaxID=1639 RepID=UPI0010F2ED5C|nr:blue-light photoreceptor [Listeria monocytogenes]EAC8104190.1 blue-light photoreceptor [Listeria monocytogenes]EKF1561027.1 blue-light photoreceptor [Listeria monocytogenes]ELU8149967.1 blue-light photoreceptor [Listeria monocytogenes]